LSTSTAAAAAAATAVDFFHSVSAVAAGYARSPKAFLRPWLHVK